MSHYCCKECGLRYDICSCPFEPYPNVINTNKPYPALKRAGTTTSDEEGHQKRMISDVIDRINKYKKIKQLLEKGLRPDEKIRQLCDQTILEMKIRLNSLY